jgi:protein-export membrane protein SecD
MLRVRPWQVVVVVLACLAGLLFAIPNVISRASLEAAYPHWLPSAQVSLGLDLQGGSHLVLEVDVPSIIRERVTGLLDEVRGKLRSEKIGYTGLKLTDSTISVQLTNPEQRDAALGALRALDKEIDVEGDAAGALRLVLSEKAATERAQSAVGQSIEIIRRRIDETGVREPTIIRQGNDRVLVQLPGVEDPERVKQLLGKTAKLTFHLIDPTISPEEAKRTGVPPSSMVLPADEARGETVKKDTPPITYVVRKRVMLSGDMLTDAQPSFQDNQPVVSFKFDSVGAKRFGDVTKENVGKPFAIVLDGKVISAPVIREPILGGSGVISGSFTAQSASDLALLLRAGALPAPMTVIEERTVGPDLGADSIRAGEIAAIIGFAAVVLFMGVYYNFFGLVADFALVLNLVLLIGMMSLLQATLTLPGIAGIVLTMGMAVDANVLIYERIREEVRNGRSPYSAMEAGYKRAWATILDSNLTTLIAAIVLYLMGTGPIKGFAVTLALGILTSMFTAVLVSRYLLVWWLQARRPKRLPV